MKQVATSIERCAEGTCVSRPFRVRAEDGNLQLDQGMRLGLEPQRAFGGFQMSEPLRNIYKQGEVPEEATIRKFRNVQMEGNREVARPVDYYNLDAPTTRAFFAKVQNKLHYAIHGNTAAELIVHRADSETQNMGLTRWEKDPHGKTLQSDVSVAKNYLSQDELESLGRIVNAYLDLAEGRAKRNIPMTMEDWAKRIDLFLEMDDRSILQDAGKVTAEIARAHAESEFEKYRRVQDRLFEGDFNQMVKQFEAGDPDPNAPKDSNDA